MNFKQGIVKILINDQLAGTGFVVSSRGLIATCSHVIQSIPDQLAGLPITENVRVEFCDGGMAIQARIVGQYWRGYPQDIAILQLENDLPQNVQALPLGSFIENRGQHFESFGYPTLHPTGLGAIGNIVTRTLWEGYSALQLVSQQLSPGHSGAPVWDGQKVVAMINARVLPGESGDNWDTRFAIPSETLIAICSEIQPITPTDIADIYNYFSIRSAHRYQEFLRIYLGTPENPVPFGGRQTELQALDDWLLTPNQPPNALLIAPGGRGKSALIVRWLTSLYEHKLAQVIFVPVSVRMGIASGATFFNTLAAQLSSAHNEPAPPQMSQENLRSLCESLLHKEYHGEQHLLIILDGLDEASDWKLDRFFFPSQPLKNQRILISARSVESETSDNSWRNRLGWESPHVAKSIVLGKLTPAGIAEVLQHMGNPLDGLAPKAEIIDTLYRLSDGGDPLLIRLYTDRLREKSQLAGFLNSDDLRAMQPGLDGYFIGWWEDQRHLWGNQSPLFNRNVTLLLDLFALAFGPLCKNDLFALITEEDQLNSSWMIEESLRQLHRWIIGDDEQGYVFQHPRLAGYFYNRLPEQERHLIEMRFIAYGQRVLNELNMGKLKPDQAPVYIVQNYQAHLNRCRITGETYSALVSSGWQRARYALDGMYSGFSSDVEHAWQAADQVFLNSERGNGIALVEQVRCALCFSSVAALNNSLSPELLALCIQEKVLSSIQGLAIASQIPDFEQRIKTLIGLAPHLPDELRAQAFRQALTAAQEFQDEDYRAGALAYLFPHIPEEIKAQTTPTIMSALQRNSSDLDWDEILVYLVPHLPDEYKTQAVQQALAEAQKKQDENDQANAIIDLIPNLPEEFRTQSIQQALILAREIRDKNDQVKVLTRLIPHLPDGFRAETIQQALVSIQEIRDKDDRTKALIYLVPHLPDALRVQVTQQALKALAIQNEDDQLEAVASLIPHLPGNLKDQIVQQVMTLAIKSENIRPQALGILAPYLPDHLKARALAIAQAIRDEGNRRQALCKLTPYLPEDLKIQALATVQAIQNEYDRAQALSELAPILPERLRAHTFQLALTAAQAIEDGKNQADALCKLATQLPNDLKTQTVQQALTSTLKIRDEDDQLEVFIALAPYLPDDLKTEILLEVQTIEYEYRKVQAMARLIPHLSGDLKVQTTQKAFAAALMIEELNVRAVTLSELAPYLPDELRNQALQQALIAAEAIYSKPQDRSPIWSRPPDKRLEQAQVLIYLIPRLSGVLKSKAIVAQSINFHSIWANILVSLAKYLPGNLKERILITAQNIETRGFLDLVMKHLPYYLQNSLSALALNYIARYPPKGMFLEKDERQGQMLNLLIPYLSSNQKVIALNAARAIRDEMTRAQVLNNLIPCLPNEFKKEALLEIQEIHDGRIKLQILSDLAFYLSGDLKTAALEQALEIVQIIGAKSDLDFWERYRPEGYYLWRAMELWHRWKDLDRRILELQLNHWERNNNQTKAFDCLVQSLASWGRSSPMQAKQAWVNFLRAVSTRPRPEFLRTTKLILPFGLSLLPESERQTVAIKILNSIKEISRWNW